MLEHILLGLLREQPMTGYELKKTIDSTVGFFYRTSFGSLYPALRRLEEKEYVIVEEVKGDSKNKKMYTLQKDGEVAFVEWLKQPLKSSKNEHLLRIFFLDYLDEEKQNFLLKEYQNKLKSERHKLKEVEKIVIGELEEITNPQDFYYRLSVLQYGVRHFEMELDWLEDIIRRKDV